MADVVGTDEGWDEVERLVMGPINSSMSGSAPEFREFMDPEINWISPAAYTEAFADLTGSTIMEAAYTTPGASLPAYINARVEGDEVVVRVRSEGQQSASEIRLPKDEWHQWLADAHRIGAE